MGGDAVVVSNLEKQQKQNGQNVAIFTSNCDEILNGLHIYKFGLKDTPEDLDSISFKRIISLLMLSFQAFTIFKIERPDVIHTHSVDMAFFVSFAARHYKIPIVRTFHIVTFYDNNQSRTRRKTELFLIRGTKAAKITAPNKYDVKKLKLAGLKNVVYLPNGIDLNFWKRNKVKDKNTLFTFISAGRLEEQKGIDHLIKAAAILRNNSSIRFKILIVGEGSLKSQLTSLVKSLQLQDYIEFSGKKSPTELRKIYESSNVAIYPSLYEATPLTLLEAWAMQLPVIATPVGILRDPYSDDTALLTKIKSEVSIERAMRKLMVDPQVRRKLVEAASKRVNKFSWLEVYNIAQNIYMGVSR